MSVGQILLFNSNRPNGIGALPHQRNSPPLINQLNWWKSLSAVAFSNIVNEIISQTAGNIDGQSARFPIWEE